MTTRSALRVIALSTTCLAALCLTSVAAIAADATAPASPAAPADSAGLSVGGTPVSGSITFGLMGVMGNNANQAGRYTGLNTAGLDAILSQFDVTGQSPWDSGVTRYYQLTGNDLVFQTGNRFGTGIGNDKRFASSTNNNLANSGSLEFRAGDQGTWDARAYFDSITYTGNVVDSLYTIFGNQGILNNGLAPFGGARPNAAGPRTAFTIPQLQATGAMQPLQTGTRRDIIGGDFKYAWGDWLFTGALRHEHKEGSLEESFDGVYGGMAFGLPINYDTNRYDLTAAYTTPLLQGSLQYTFSQFTDNNLFVTLPYPVSGTAAPFQRAAAYSTPPSNSAHYLTLMLASNAIPDTRINLNARVGLEKQDNTFPPNTADPGLSTGILNAAQLNSLARGTTANSPDIVATVYQVKLSAVTRPIANMDAHAFYGIDARDVTLNQHEVFGSGSGSDSSLGGFAFVVPQEWFKQNLGGEIGYRILPETNTKLTAAYRLDLVDRSNAQVGHSSTNTGSIALSSEISPEVNGKLSVEFAQRTGTLSYLTPWLNLIGPTAGQTFSGAYYQAPMTSAAVRLRTDYSPSNELSGSFFLQFKNEDYTYSHIPLIAGATPSTIPLTGVGGGVKQDMVLSLGPDLNYRPTANLNFHVFYTFERLYYVNQGNGNCATAADIANPANGCTGSVGYNQNKQTSDTHTVGLSAEWQATEKLKLQGDYTVSYGSVMFTEFNGVFVPNPTQSYQNVSNYPDIDSLMHSVRLTATYEVRTGLDLLLQGIYTAFHNNDWNDTANAIQGAGTSAISILTPGYASPNYSVVAIMGGVKIRF